MNTANYIREKFNKPLTYKHLPMELPNFGRNNLPELFKELGFKKGAEVGVEAGLYSEIICKGIPGVELFCIDAWQAFNDYRDNLEQEKVDEIYRQAQERLIPYGAKLIKGLSLDVVKTFADNSLDFVYIDANHTFDAVLTDVTEWSKKVRPGGIIAGHDFVRKDKKYIKSQNNRVVDALHHYTESNNINSWYVLGRKSKRPGEIRDNVRSWLIVKE